MGQAHWEDGSEYMEPGALSFRIGIDPYGSESYTSSNIVWSSYYDPHDAWYQFEVTATATATQISVWAYAKPSGYWLFHNETFWDGAGLEVVSGSD